MYIDPAAGSLILQVLAAGILSAFAMIGQLRRAVVSFFKSVIHRRRV